MEEETTVALVPSSQKVVFTAPRQHSFHNLTKDFTLVCNNAPKITEPTEEINPGSRDSKVCFTWEALSVVISTLYCKLLVVLGFALPVTRTITTIIPAQFYDVFYVYLYGWSLIFMFSLHIISFLKNRARKLSNKKFCNDDEHEKFNTHGSFYLRLGACGFGVGSMVYSGLEFGGYFIQTDSDCDTNVLSVAKPALRMIFTLLQIQFIFLNDNSFLKTKLSSLLRIGFGHMLATNLAEWLNVVIEETKHEIHHLHPLGNARNHHGESNHSNGTNCEESNSNILISNTTSYLFPCTIEYSLICAVTLVELLKDIRIDKKKGKGNKPVKHSPLKKDSRLYSVDCSHTDKGLVAGLIANVYTLISLIVFFSIRTSQQETAYFCLTLCESILNASSLIAMTKAAVEMRSLPYCIHRIDSKGSLKLGLDISLLLKAQIGLYIYSVFSAIACYFSPDASLWPDVFCICQTSIQTIFIIDSWWKRCATPKDQDKKPGRQCLTFLRSVNVAMWIITITEKNRAELKPVQLKFYGMWAWTIITHTSMPLYVFYRFHSSICFFEIWRNSYKGIHVAPDSDVLF